MDKEHATTQRFCTVVEVALEGIVDADVPFYTCWDCEKAGPVVEEVLEGVDDEAEDESSDATVDVPDVKRGEDNFSCEI